MTVIILCIFYMTCFLTFAGNQGDYCSADLNRNKKYKLDHHTKDVRQRGIHDKETLFQFHFFYDGQVLLDVKSQTLIVRSAALSSGTGRDVGPFRTATPAVESRVEHSYWFSFPYDTIVG